MLEDLSSASARTFLECLPLYFSNKLVIAFTLLKVFKLLNSIKLFAYFLQSVRTGCGIVQDITSARYRLSYGRKNRRLLFA